MKRRKPYADELGDANNWTASVRTGTRRAALVGYFSIALFGGTFVTWASSAPLARAAVAQGVVAAEGQHQTVQHLEGGILRAVHVKEGERVTTGEVLFDMDTTRARAQLNALIKQWIGLKARAARLAAQRDLSDGIEFAPDLLRTANRLDLSELLKVQEREFDARLSRFRSEAVILSRRVKSGKEAISGLQSQKQALEQQLKVVREETSRKKGLLDRGLTDRSEYTLLLRSEADLVGQIGAIVSHIAQSRTAVSEAQEQLVRQQTVRLQDALNELNEVTAEAARTEEQIAAARDVLDRLVVRSPADGLVISISQNTPGSVVPPGGQLAEILPTSSDLIIEARLEPGDIDAVRPGQEARLRFLALNARHTPLVDGKVTYVSADRLVDQATREPYYLVRLSITDRLPEEVDGAMIYPGMPVEAMISTSTRTFFEYLVRPLEDSFSRAFREE